MRSRGLFLASMFGASSALAQQQAEAKPAPAEEPQVNSQVASFAVTKLRDSPAVVTSVDAEEISRSGARDLLDVLLLVPGFFFGVDIQGIVGPGFRGLWGYEGKILLLVDGKEMNELLYSTTQLGKMFPVELIERVELVRGPGSVVYGGFAELAVINVITRGLPGSTDVLVSGTYGQLDNTYGRRGVTLSGRKVFDSVPGLSTFVSASYSQGQRSGATYVDAFGNEASMANASMENPLVLQAGVGYRDLQLSLLYHQYETSGIDGYDELLAAPLVGTFQSLHLELTDTFRPAERVEVTPRINYALQRPWMTSDRSSDFYYEKQAQRLRARLTARWAPLDVLQLTGGADLTFDRADLLGPPDIGLQTLFNGAAESISYQNYAAFLEAYSENPVVNVALGARLELHSASGATFVPRLVLVRSFGPFSAKALFSSAFRAPGVENISLGDSVTPERTTVFELEGALRLSRAHQLALNVFDVGIVDPIIYSYDAATMSEAYRNVGRLGSRGLEVDWRFQWQWARAEASYGFYAPNGDAQVETYLVPGHPEAHAALPNHRATLSASARLFDRLSLSSTAVLIGPRFSVGAPDEAGVSAVEELPTQLLLNVFFRAQDVGVRGLEVGAGVYNLLGSDLRLAQPYQGGHAPLPALGREFLLKVTYSFDAWGA